MRVLRVILCDTDEDPAREAPYLRLIEGERVTGIILLRAIAATRLTDLPVVLIDRCPPGAAHDAVVLDNRAAAGMPVDPLHAAGHRRIAGLFGANRTTGRERYEGYRERIAALGLEEFVAFVPHRRTNLSPATASCFSVVRAERRARRARHHAHRLRQRAVDQLVHGGITPIAQPVDRIGAEALAMLLDRLRTPDAPLRKLMLAGRLVVRDTR